MCMLIQNDSSVIKLTYRCDKLIVVILAELSTLFSAKECDFLLHSIDSLESSEKNWSS